MILVFYFKCSYFITVSTFQLFKMTPSHIRGTLIVSLMTTFVSAANLQLLRETRFALTVTAIARHLRNLNCRVERTPGWKLRCRAPLQVRTGMAPQIQREDSPRAGHALTFRGLTQNRNGSWNPPSQDLCLAPSQGWKLGSR